MKISNHEERADPKFAANPVEYHPDFPLIGGHDEGELDCKKQCNCEKKHEKAIIKFKGVVTETTHDDEAAHDSNEGLLIITHRKCSHRDERA